MINDIIINFLEKYEHIICLSCLFLFLYINSKKFRCLIIGKNNEKKYQENFDKNIKTNNNLIFKSIIRDSEESTIISFYLSVTSILYVLKMFNKIILFNYIDVNTIYLNFIKDKTPMDVMTFVAVNFTSVYVILGLIFLFIDIFKLPNFIYKYKIHKDKTITKKQFIKLIFILSINLGMPPFYFVILRNYFKNFIVIKITDWGINLTSNYFLKIYDDVPSLMSISYSWFIFILSFDILFYVSHRLLHEKQFYKHIHKIHHEFKYPTALASAYSHPIEYIISNLGPTTLSIVILKPHFVSLCIFAPLGIIGVVMEHCGYNLSHGLGFHEIHHNKFNYNYGVSPYFDRYFGTFIDVDDVNLIQNNKKKNI